MQLQITISQYKAWVYQPLGVDNMNKLRTVMELLEKAEKAFNEANVKGFEAQAFMHYANKAWLAVYDLMKEQLL